MGIITPRLLAIANMIKDEKCVADIGTDHGYIPIYLAKKHTVKKIYCTDVAEEPLNKARNNINSFGVQKDIEIVKSDGISWIKEYRVKVDTCIIAGMGSKTILQILKEDCELIDCYVICCNTNNTPIRQWAKEHKYFIESEVIVKDNDIIYEVIKINKHAGKKIKNLKDLYFGPILRKTKNNKIYFEKWLLEEQRQNKLLSKIPVKTKKYKDTLKYNKKIKKMINKVIKDEFKS
ncbi:class I SAM-dependent methyltransferase [Spiroplasma endosymbiont of Crioceris asparagi]|uniref:tRNA (adenine(22)-N(1))-methyltransferase n=1 Tax=Spiroplasma endosymbiont of Crioceris asparagi TaxID=3066286 RepID=UPI0030CD6272